jgi:squalene-hopene/tetraprenyl-beta-curcumene cyclase
MTSEIDSKSRTLQDVIEALKATLLAARSPRGPWNGELSSSALSTATAAFALHCADSHRPLIGRGIEWLVRNQNADGGWGDTIESPSNLSTTLLCFSALAVPEGPSEKEASITRARQWLSRAAGSLDPASLAAAVDRQYGKDKTFSVPILTLCALAGRLGEGEQAWRLIRPLPFELAILPPRLYRSVHLPVVSYALPALIAMGQAHFAHRRPRCPVTRTVRGLSRARSLRVLTSLQPENGGFLEAAPLTSFVLMCLASSGYCGHQVARRAVDFLAAGIRDDGSWPIDTNLTTWVTTLSIKALACADPEHGLAEPLRGELTGWLLRTQHTRVHPYTQAALGGWAWSDLPGAVPDADDTAGALLALHALDCARPEVAAAAPPGIEWLLGLQNRDGGIPTFCRGWTELPFDKSTPDITAHALGAMGAWLPGLRVSLRRRVQTAMTACVRYLGDVQKPDGSWSPLWFGNQEAPDHANPVYGTSRVLTHLVQGLRSWDRAGHVAPQTLAPMLTRAGLWLVSVQNPDGGWGGAASTRSTIEETAVALDALAECLLLARGPQPGGGLGIPVESLHCAAARGAAWLVASADPRRPLPASPIGLYFARLWYHERLYPLAFALGALGKFASASNVQSLVRDAG